VRRGAPGSAGWSRCGSRTVASPPPRRSVVLAPLPEISPPESRESPRGLLATLGPPVVRGTKDAELRTGEDGDRPAQAHLVWLGLTGVGRASAPDIPDRRPCLPGVRRAAAPARDHHEDPRWLGRFSLTWGSRLSAQSLHPRGRRQRRRDRSISPAIEVQPSGMEFEQRGGAVPGPGSWAGVRARGAAAESS